MKRKLLTLLFSTILAVSLAACGTQEATFIEKNEAEHKDYIASAVTAMADHTLALQEGLYWGASYAQVKEVVKEPYINDDGQYLSTAFYSALPADENWKDKDGKIDASHFIQTDILSYHVVDASVGLYEYGYLAPDANLHQYDYLKDYYTKKYGEPEREDWEWNDENYKPTGEENYYEKFAAGEVKVVTVWDIEELNTVLVIDWLNDPVKYNNNYGQISFYARSEDFSADDVSDVGM